MSTTQCLDEPLALQEPKRVGARVVETWVVEQEKKSERSRISPAALKRDVRFHARHVVTKIACRVAATRAFVSTGRRFFVIAHTRFAGLLLKEERD